MSEHSAGCHDQVLPAGLFLAKLGCCTAQRYIETPLGLPHNCYGPPYQPAAPPWPQPGAAVAAASTLTPPHPVPAPCCCLHALQAQLLIAWCLRNKQQQTWQQSEACGSWQQCMSSWPPSSTGSTSASCTHWLTWRRLSSGHLAQVWDTHVAQQQQLGSHSPGINSSWAVTG
jgi:hypothetical protein